MLLVCVFAVTEDELTPFRARTRTAVGLLGEQPGCRSVSAGPSVDEPGRWVLTARFDSVPAYRRALSPFAVREHVAPLLAQCLGGRPTTFEVLLEASDGAVVEHETLRGTSSGPRPWAGRRARDDR